MESSLTKTVSNWEGGEYSYSNKLIMTADQSALSKGTEKYVHGSHYIVLIVLIILYYGSHD